MSSSPESTDHISPRKNGFCVYVDTWCDGPVVAVHNENDKPLVFQTERAAQLEIVDSLMIRLNQFIDGEREFDDAINVDEYVVPVWVSPDGIVCDENGRKVDGPLKQLPKISEFSEKFGTARTCPP